MPIVRLTATNVSTLPAGRDGRRDYFDGAAHTPGFGLRVAASGRRAWFLMYRVGRRQKRFALGTWPPMGLADARTAARRQLLLIQTEHADPAAAKQARRTAQTFAALADRFIEDYAKPHKRSWRADARQLRTMARPAWKGRIADEITRSDVRELLAAVARARSGITANRLRSCLSKLFRWSVAQGYLDANPASELPRLVREPARERVLSDDELVTFWTRLADAEARWTANPDAEAGMSPAVALWLRLRLLTGQRGGSVAAMRWAHVDLERRVWEIPAADMKAGHPHVVPLAPWVCELLTARRAGLPKEAVYVLAGGRARRVRLGVTAIIGIEDFEPRDLRRTCATAMARRGTPRFIIARVLGHVDRSVTGIYDRFEYLDEKRVALDAWARTLKAIVTEQATGAAVVPFARGR